MYTEQDGKMIRQRIKKYSVILAVGLAILLAAFIVGLSVNVRSNCLLYTSPSPRDLAVSRMPSSA